MIKPLELTFLLWDIKKCRKCGEKAVRKDGRQNGHQRYRCHSCDDRFQNSQRLNGVQKKIWHLYVHRKQTYCEIAKDFRRSTRWVQQMIDGHVPKLPHIGPCRTPLVIDAMFFGRENGILVFRSPTLRKNLGWWTIEKEEVDDYELGVAELRLAGFEITGVTVDGRPGVLRRLESLGLPVQMCHFHQIQIVSRYTTRYPRLLAAKELLNLARLLPQTDEASFCHWLEEWHKRWGGFLDEKSWDELRRRWRYTHERLRKAHRSLTRHLPYLFTYHHHPDMPNTTNSLDGSFGHLRDRIGVHRGLRWHRKIKLAGELLGH